MRRSRDEGRVEPGGLAGGLDVGKPREDLAQDLLDLDACDVGAETEVGAASAEGDVLVGRAAGVEAVSWPTICTQIPVASAIGSRFETEPSSKRKFWYCARSCPLSPDSFAREAFYW